MLTSKQRFEIGEKILLQMAGAIVGDESCVRVEMVEEDRKPRFRLFVPNDDCVKHILGAEGSTLKSMRRVMSAAMETTSPEIEVIPFECECSDECTNNIPKSIGAPCN